MQTAAVADDASKAAPAVDTGVSADKFQPLPLTDKEVRCADGACSTASCGGDISYADMQALNDNSNIYVFTTKGDARSLPQC